MDSQSEQTACLIRRGLDLMSNNKLQEAKNIFTRICETNPRETDAWYQLSTINGRMADFPAADECCRRVLDIQPDHCEARINLGNVLYSQGKFDDAIIEYQRAIQISPNHAVAHSNLGNLLAAVGKNDEAAAAFQAAIALNPNLFIAFYGLGNLRLTQRLYDKAANCYKRAIQLNPDDATSHNKLGIVLTKEGKITEALASFREAVRLKPDYVEAYNNISNIFFHQRNREEALQQFDYGRWLDTELVKFFSLSDVDGRTMRLLTIHHLKHKYNLKSEDYDDSFVQAFTEHLASDDLFLQFLAKTFNIDADLERLLTKVRRSLLFKHCLDDSIGAGGFRVVVALAFQGLNNEYVFASDEEEDRQVAGLKDSIEQLVPALTAPTEALERKLLVFGMYDRFYSLSCRSRLSDMPATAWSEAIRSLLEQTLTIPLEEENIKQEILAIGTIEDKTSQLVQSQYEENPYPRWLSIPEIENRSIGCELKHLFPHFVPPPSLDGPVDILIAGCGTGQQAIQTAMYNYNVEVLAVDISKSSLAYAIRMAKKYNVKNVQFMQGDILELAALNKQFHVIKCSGVLHHMQAPLAGWKVLTNLLVQHGLMQIGLYSELARKQIVAAREIIKDERIIPNRKNIRNFRMRILSHEMGDLLYKITNFNDFYSTSECRDLLFHCMEHRFTLVQINKILTDLNLAFLGFEFPFVPVNIDTAKLYRAHFPDDRKMQKLAWWDQFEAIYPDTFISMYNFWCKKRDDHSLTEQFRPD
jgi:Tfp pilus assembly protein PilF/2-polyprenyl-3-methyl-5-hydroxy-6-metoxy-1,4-benzoquinol methylase